MNIASSLQPSLKPSLKPFLKRALAVLLLAMVSACATVPAPGQKASPAAAIDPWENWNRKVFAFNEGVDEAVLRPVATAYRDAVPSFVRTGVSNFFGNIGDVWSTANHFLQGKVGTGLDMGMRVLTNTIFGLGGVLDPATEASLPKRPEDFGQTLAVWGVPNGPFVMLPLFGPSTLRDTTAFPLDAYATSTSNYFDHVNNYVVTPLYVVQTRSELLATTQLISDVSLDKYSFIRDAYLARRRNQIYDGSPPLEAFEDDNADPPEKKK